MRAVPVEDADILPPNSFEVSPTMLIKMLSFTLYRLSMLSKAAPLWPYINALR